MLLGAKVLSGSDNFLNESVSTSAPPINRLRVYLEGSRLDYDYIRRNIGFVDFINDPKASDVHIIVTTKHTGGGGTNYILNFYSHILSQIGDLSLNCISAPGDTDDEIRECITRTMKLGLMPYVNETLNGSRIDILYSNDVSTSDEIVLPLDDPWKQWVFRIDANGGFNLEEQIQKYNYSFNMRADKVTDELKLRASYYMRDRFEEITSNESVFSSKEQLKSANLSSIFSLSGRWSAGMFLSFFQSTYWNTRHSYDAKPAVEYNFFPWEEADKRVFTISYFAGIEMKNYFETTIFGKEDENLWAQNLRVNFEVIQPWGEIETRLEGASYFHDFSKNRITFDTDISFRITRGISFNLGFRAENIHNQLYLPAGELSIEDMLLGNQKLPSTFDLYGGMGIRFQFGSLYNNVVNNRL